VWALQKRRTSYAPRCQCEKAPRLIRRNKGKCRGTNVSLITRPLSRRERLRRKSRHCANRCRLLSLPQTIPPLSAASTLQSLVSTRDFTTTINTPVPSVFVRETRRESPSAGAQCRHCFAIAARNVCKTDVTNGGVKASAVACKYPRAISFC
jgi:hypothetical protein